MKLYFLAISRKSSLPERNLSILFLSILFLYLSPFISYHTEKIVSCGSYYFCHFLIHKTGERTQLLRKEKSQVVNKYRTKKSWIKLRKKNFPSFQLFEIMSLNKLLLIFGLVSLTVIGLTTARPRASKLASRTFLRSVRADVSFTLTY